jgi:hypothetical protein
MRTSHPDEAIELIAYPDEVYEEAAAHPNEKLHLTIIVKVVMSHR